MTKNAAKETTAAGTSPSRDQQVEPRLPHEHDESADSQVGASEAAKAMGQKAFADVKAGRVDTGRGPEMDRAYQAQRRPGTPRK